MNADNLSSRRVTTVRRSAAAVFAGTLLCGAVLFPAIASADDFTQRLTITIDARVNAAKS